MTRRQRVVVTLALGHLLSVVAFIWTGAADGVRGAAGDTLRLHKNLSGAFRDYKFFAPAVASDLKAGFLLEDAAGGLSFIDFRSENREVAFKFNSIVGTSMRDNRARDLLAQSWAALMLGRHPRATSVTVMVEAFDLPTMAEFRAGGRPRWRVIYAAQFARPSPA